MDKNVSKATAQAITGELEVVIREVFEKHGLDYQGTKTIFGEYYELKVKAVAVSLNDNGVNMSDPMATDFVEYASIHGFGDNAEAALGVPFTFFNGETVRIIGYSYKNRKYPVIYTKDSDPGGRWKTSEHILKAHPMYDADLDLIPVRVAGAKRVG